MIRKWNVNKLLLTDDDGVSGKLAEFDFTIDTDEGEQINVNLSSDNSIGSLLGAFSYRINYTDKDGKKYFIQNKPAGFSGELLRELKSGGFFGEYESYAEIDFNSPGILRDNRHFIPDSIIFPYRYKKEAIEDFISLLLQIPDYPPKTRGYVKRHIKEMMLNVKINTDIINHLLYAAFDRRLFKFDNKIYFYDLFESFLNDPELTEDAGDAEFRYYDVELEDWYTELSKLEKGQKEIILDYIRNDFRKDFHEFLKDRCRFTKPCGLTGPVKKAVGIIRVFITDIFPDDAGKDEKLELLRKVL